MKLLSVSIFLFVAFLLAPEIKGQSTTSPFIGNWMLDKVKTNTSKDFPEKLKNYKMAITGDAAAFNVRSQVEGNIEVKAAGNGSLTPTTESASQRGRESAGIRESSTGGSQKINYGGTMALYFTVNNGTYNLSGEESKIETEQGRVRIKAKADKSGKSLQFTTIRNMKTPKGEMEVTIRESWKLLDDKSIKLYRIVETNTTRDEITMVLNKVS